MRWPVLVAGAFLSMVGPSCALAAPSQECVDCLKAQSDAAIDEAVFTTLALPATLLTGGTLFVAIMVMASTMSAFELDSYLKLPDCDDICSRPDPGPPSQPICQVNRPLLKAGDDASATMQVSSNHVCACGFARSDGWLAVVSTAANGSVSASANACTYQSRSGFKGIDHFTLRRGWPEGGTATVTFVVTVVD
jgi:hypothetical protein